MEQFLATIDASAGHSVFQHGGALRQTAPLCGLTEGFRLARRWGDDVGRLIPALTHPLIAARTATAWLMRWRVAARAGDCQSRIATFPGRKAAASLRAFWSAPPSLVCHDIEAAIRQEGGDAPPRRLGRKRAASGNHGAGVPGPALHLCGQQSWRGGSGRKSDPDGLSQGWRQTGSIIPDMFSDFVAILPGPYPP
ncbi:hypothetical protein AD940_00525 [Gluconobacter thailandicus]|nr:hypothetical protein AD940_00525 [Gluconobacter thailandicus]